MQRRSALRKRYLESFFICDCNINDSVKRRHLRVHLQKSNDSIPRKTVTKNLTCYYRAVPGADHMSKFDACLPTSQKALHRAIQLQKGIIPIIIVWKFVKIWT